MEYLENKPESGRDEAAGWDRDAKRAGESRGKKKGEETAVWQSLRY